MDFDHKDSEAIKCAKAAINTVKMSPLKHLMVQLFGHNRVAYDGMSYVILRHFNGKDYLWRYV